MFEAHQLLVMEIYPLPTSTEKLLIGNLNCNTNTFTIFVKRGNHNQIEHFPPYCILIYYIFFFKKHF